jgi:hypothetical protein
MSVMARRVDALLHSTWWEYPERSTTTAAQTRKQLACSIVLLCLELQHTYRNISLATRPATMTLVGKKWTSRAGELGRSGGIDRDFKVLALRTVGVDLWALLL